MELERQHKVSSFRLKVEIYCSLKLGREIHWSLKRREWPTGHSNRPVSSPVCSPVVAVLPKKCPRHRRKTCVNSLWLYSNYTQSSSSKNKNMNYIFIYLRVSNCLSNGTICSTSIWYWFWFESNSMVLIIAIKL